jgi:predicted transcriptional regulator
MMMTKDWTMTKQPKQAKVRAGRKETLTKELARKIANMIQQFPDSGIEVSWKNVIEQVNRRYDIKFHRNTLSQKEWEGQKLIAVAFDDAEAIQKRMVKENAPKYADTPRSRLRLTIAKLQAENLALREQLADVRAQQFDEAHSLLDLRTPLHRLVGSVAGPPPKKMTVNHPAK